MTDSDPRAAVVFEDCENITMRDLSFTDCGPAIHATRSRNLWILGMNVTGHGVRQGDSDGLEHALEKMGVPRSRLNDLMSLVERANPEDRASRCQKWFDAFSAEVAAGAVVAVSQAQLPTVAGAIIQFLGIG